MNAAVQPLGAAASPAADALRRFAAVVLADWRERSRSIRFLAVLAAMATLSWWLFPPLGAAYLTVAIDGPHRGAYSSAWVGMVLALVFSTLFSLASFYMVRGTLTRDIDSRVWQLLVATPMRRSTYLLAKWSSHVLVMLSIALIALLVGLAAQLVRAEDRHIDLVELVKPMLVLSVPGFAITAMFAIWFDLVPWLRHTAGNVLYFFVWIALLSLSLTQVLPQHRPSPADAWVSDPGGVITFVHAVERLELHGARLVNLNVVRPVLHDTVSTFAWAAWPVRAVDLRAPLAWFLLALAGVALAARCLDWGAARASRTSARAREGSGARLRWLAWLLGPLQRSATGALVAAETQLVLRSRRAWWWLLVLVSFGVQSFAPPPIVAMAAIASWALLLDVLGGAVLRESETRTAALVFSAAHARTRVLATRWTMLTALTWLATLPALLHLAIARPTAALALLAIGASLSAWGLALGAATRNARSFELLFVVLAYVSLNGAPALNVGIAPWTTLAAHLALLPVAAVLLSLAWPRLCRLVR